VAARSADSDHHTAGTLRALTSQLLASTKRHLRGMIAQPRKQVMSKEKTLSDLFHDTLKDIYFAEKRILVHFRKWQRRSRLLT
jgi:hypothetical protein